MKHFSFMIFIASFCNILGENPDPLPSWNEGAVKSNIINFVETAVNPKNTEYVNPADRVAVFDNDGTLWCEKPLYIHVYAIIDRNNELIGDSPKFKDLQPYKAIYERDINYFKNLYQNHAFDTLLSHLIGVPFGGMSTEDFDDWCKNWLLNWKHPGRDVGYQMLVYQPMVELIKFLQANQFAVHIFTADEAAFLRLVSEDLYGIVPERVHGSSVKCEYIVEDDKPSMIRTYQADYFCNWSIKPLMIEQRIGKRPIFAAGNSNGDYQMLQYTALQEKKSLSILINHTDELREYKYDNDKDQIQKLVRKKNVTVVDMKNDWKKVFP